MKTSRTPPADRQLELGRQAARSAAWTQVVNDKMFHIISSLSRAGAPASASPVGLPGAHASVRAPRVGIAAMLLPALLAAAFLLGGSARSDGPGLLVLWPLSLIFLGIACAELRRESLAEYSTVLMVLGGGLALALIQLIPLPAALWHALPGRELIAQIDRAAGLGEPARPLTMDPPATLVAALALVLPLAVVLLAAQLPSFARARLVLIVLAAGALSALLGVVQMLGDPNGPLYFYTPTNNGSPVGLFANRNHQAVALACLVPLALAAATLPRLGQDGQHRAPHPLAMPAAVLAVGLLVPLIFITGSRSGLVAAQLALVGSPLVISRRGAARAAARVSVLIAAVISAATGAAALWLGRDFALERLFGTNLLNDLRVRMLPTLHTMLGEYFVWGSGLGSFERVYMIHEPAELLQPAYVNHAHNDWLELIITGGLPAAALVLALIVSVVWRAITVFKRADSEWQPLRRAALLCLAIMALASLSDYPLRTPFFAALLSLCLVWLFMDDETAGVGASAPSARGGNDRGRGQQEENCLSGERRA